MKVSELLNQASKKLSTVSGKPKLEALILLEKTTKKKREKLIIDLDSEIPEKLENRYKRLIEKRVEKRIPLSYILGYREFYSLKFITNKHVLIPRIETEGLVDLALNFLRKKKNPRILDIATGSGNIIIAIAKNFGKRAKYFASDLSLKALKVAQKNAELHNVKINFFSSDLLNSIKETEYFDLIISNPPYVSISEYLEVSEEVKKEPKIALLSPEDGLFYIKRIIISMYKYLKKDGKLIIEIGENQKVILAKQFPFLEFRKDIFNRWRFLCLKKI